MQRVAENIVGRDVTVHGFSLHRPSPEQLHASVHEEVAWPDRVAEDGIRVEECGRFVATTRERVELRELLRMPTSDHASA